MKTSSIIPAYETFCHLMVDERLYIDPTLSFGTVCDWLGADPAALDALLEEELGFSGPALLEHFRRQLNTRLRDTYGIAR